MKVLSLDFDFFVENSDLVVADTLRSKSALWEEREREYQKHGMKMENMFPFVGPDFDEFLSHFDLRKADYLDVWDSHSDILAFIRDKKDLEICNVDSHHDIAYLEKLCDINVVDCGNWGGYLISRYKVRSWIQVYPEWRKKKPEKTFDYHVKNAWAWESTIISKNLDGVKFIPDLVFLCRSSPWVPPIYDGKFNELCELLMKKGKFTDSPPRLPRTEDVKLFIPSGHNVWYPSDNPMTPRRTRGSTSQSGR